ncbi:MAG: glycosyl hydrolase, partial [Saprospiraceae bacterium]|nr:glycosyl hydrolase [Saprospiraceae bacterium]
QPTAQFYRVTTDNAFPYRIYAAQQDNSTIRIQHRSDDAGINERHWQSTAGGESGHIAVDPLDNDVVYGGSYGGFLIRMNHRTQEERAINVWPDNPMGYGAEGMKYRFQWNFPIFFSPNNPQKLYALSNHVHVTYNGGESWEILSPDLTRNDPTKLGPSGGPITKDNTSVEYYCTLFRRRVAL